MSLKSQTIQQLTRRVFFGAGEPINWPLPNEMMGIELEAESVYVGTLAPLTLAGWTMDRDGSLRNDGREFVLSQPLAGSSLTRAIHTLFEMQSPARGQMLRYQVNPRAGTHVHINWIENTVGSAAALIALMYMIEPLVYSWADEDRAWCSYCNPLSDIPASVLNKLLRMDDDEDDEDEWLLREIDDEAVGRYHGLNIVALAKYGTFEFRYFPSTARQTDMIKWVKFVQLAKRCAVAFENDVPSLVERLLQGDVAAFLQEYFDVDGIAAELLTAVNNADSIVVEKAGEIGAIMEMRPNNVGIYSSSLSPAARRYIERFASTPRTVEDDYPPMARAGWATAHARPASPTAAGRSIQHQAVNDFSAPIFDGWFNETTPTIDQAAVVGAGRTYQQVQIMRERLLAGETPESILSNPSAQRYRVLEDDFSSIHFDDLNNVPSEGEF